MGAGVFGDPKVPFTPHIGRAGDWKLINGDVNSLLVSLVLFSLQIKLAPQVRKLSN